MKDIHSVDTESSNFEQSKNLPEGRFLCIKN